MEGTIGKEGKEPTSTLLVFPQCWGQRVVPAAEAAPSIHHVAGGNAAVGAVLWGLLARALVGFRVHAAVQT